MYFCGELTQSHLLSISVCSHPHSLEEGARADGGDAGDGGGPGGDDEGFIINGVDIRVVQAALANAKNEHEKALYANILRDLTAPARSEAGSTRSRRSNRSNRSTRSAKSTGGARRHKSRDRCHGNNRAIVSVPVPVS